MSKNDVYVACGQCNNFSYVIVRCLTGAIATAPPCLPSPHSWQRSHRLVYAFQENLRESSSAHPKQIRCARRLIRHLMLQRSRFQVSCVHPNIVYSNLGELVTVGSLLGPLCVMAREVQFTNFLYRVPCERFQEGRFFLDALVPRFCL